MSEVATLKNDRANKSKTSNESSWRETIESIIIAFILAFLFRAFVAEAFVIPTGSMAPTLMGAHKDITCEHCGAQYQASGSSEFDNATQKRNDRTSIASFCANCRALNAYDLRGNANHATFSGDRILVSKFDYVLSKPERWDVFVFKFPLSPHMNFIKRLVGLPGEQLKIEGGDIYTRKASNEPWRIERKPASKILSMRQVVSDTEFRARELIAANWPSLWQPASIAGTDETGKWIVRNDVDAWSASLKPSTGRQWLRYYHNFVPDDAWIAYRVSEKLPPAPELGQSRLITDFNAYNTDLFAPREKITNNSGKLVSEITSEFRPFDYVLANNIGYGSNSTTENDGLHWVGDLSTELELEIESSSGTASIELVEFGIHFQCDIDVATGEATFQAIDGSKKLPIFAGGKDEMKAQTSLKGPGNYRVQLANFDDRLTLWVDGDPVQLPSDGDFDLGSYRTKEQRRPHWSPTDPGDAAPIAIGGSNVQLTVTQAKVFRDIYYIAIQNQTDEFVAYNLGDVVRMVPDPIARQNLSDIEAVHEIYAHPEWWSDTELFGMRGSLEFDIKEDQYFPMGDNSAASADARNWTASFVAQTRLQNDYPRSEVNSARAHHYVEQRFLLGKALLVFWPHTWNRPPFFPNFERMKLIR